jgi:hypothetical protein
MQAGLSERFADVEAQQDTAAQTDFAEQVFHGSTPARQRDLHSCELDRGYRRRRCGPCRLASAEAFRGIGDGVLDRPAYQDHDDELTLIRPDGHIGLRTQDAAAVPAYLAAVPAS